MKTKMYLLAAVFFVLSIYSFPFVRSAVLFVLPTGVRPDDIAVVVFAISFGYYIYLRGQKQNV